MLTASAARGGARTGLAGEGQSTRSGGEDEEDARETVELEGWFQVEFDGEKTGYESNFYTFTRRRDDEMSPKHFLRVHHLQHCDKIIHVLSRL